MRQPSLTRHLLGWILGALILVWVFFIILGYRTGQHEADELTDGHLAGVTALLLSHGAGTVAPSDVARRTPAPAPNLKAHDYQQSISVVVWNGAGEVLAQSGDAPAPTFEQTEGFATLSLGQPPSAWRVFSRWDEGKERKVMVLLSLRERDDLAQDIAEQMAEPGLWLLPVVALALGLAIRRGLRPLYALSRDVDRLDIRELTPLEPQSRHEEFRAAVVAINTLMERYHAALNRERELAGEFAHEIRTPLAAVSLHARALEHMPDGPERDEILRRLERDVQRAGRVLADLLSLARASRAEWDEASQPLDLVAIASDAVADFAPIAHRSGHELMLRSSEPFPTIGHALLLELALRNLIENAISHTPRGTRVEVRLDAAAGWIEVGDLHEGLTAAPTNHHGVSLPSLGLGLGHRVVEKIAAIHGAKFSRVAEPGFNSCYRILFPKPNPRLKPTESTTM